MSYAKYVARPAVPSGKTARGNARTRPSSEHDEMSALSTPSISESEDAPESVRTREHRDSGDRRRIDDEPQLPAALDASKRPKPEAVEHPPQPTQRVRS